MDTMLVFWISFIVLFFVVFIIDMYATNHRKNPLTVKVALRWTGFWVFLAMMYGVAIYFFFPQNPGSDVRTSTVVMLKFISGYLTEYSLSIDNLFVFIMIFSLMAVHEKNQPKLLKYGILLSIVLRILFIMVGMGLVQQFSWIIYVFGAILLWTAYKMAFTDEEDQVDPSGNFLFKTASKVFPVDPDTHAEHFFKKINGKLHITTIFLVFLVIGSTDVLFAVDSIPAIIGVIKEGANGILTPGEENFIAITSNVFAVMGLVSLFFALKGIMGMFRYLKHGVSFILFFIGLKMIFAWYEPIEHFFKSYSWVSLAVIIFTLIVSMILSVIIKEQEEIEELKHELQVEMIKEQADIELLKKEIEELKKNKDLEH